MIFLEFMEEKMMHTVLSLEVGHIFPQVSAVPAPSGEVWEAGEGLGRTWWQEDLPWMALPRDLPGWS